MIKTQTQSNKRFAVEQDQGLSSFALRRNTINNRADVGASGLAPANARAAALQDFFFPIFGLS